MNDDLESVVFSFDEEIAEQSKQFYAEDFLYDDSSEGANENESYDPWGHSFTQPWEKAVEN